MNWTMSIMRMIRVTCKQHHQFGIIKLILMIKEAGNVLLPAFLLDYFDEKQWENYFRV